MEHILAQSISSLVVRSLHRGRGPSVGVGTRPGLVALLDYARPGDSVVVAAIDRLGRSVAAVTRTIADLGERRITLHVLREGVDTATPTGRAIAAIMASLAELELELGRERAPHPENPVAPGICRPPNLRSSAQNGKNSCAGLL